MGGVELSISWRHGSIPSTPRFACSSITEPLRDVLASLPRSLLARECLRDCSTDAKVPLVHSPIQPGDRSRQPQDARCAHSVFPLPPLAPFAAPYVSRANDLNSSSRATLKHTLKHQAPKPLQPAGLEKWRRRKGTEQARLGGARQTHTPHPPPPPQPATHLNTNCTICPFVTHILNARPGRRPTLERK